MELLALLALLVFAGGGEASPRARRDGFVFDDQEDDDVPTNVPTTADPQNWVWPMPALDGAAPVVSSGWGSPRPAHGGEAAHRHVGDDVMYERVPPLPKSRKPPPHEHRQWFVPEGTHAIAARAGKVWSVSQTSMGWRVVIDHGAPWATVYQHLEQVFLPKHHRGRQLDGSPPYLVEQGEPLGFVGYDPSDPQGLRHLHFELWHGNGPVDPWPSLKQWRVLR